MRSKILALAACPILILGLSLAALPASAAAQVIVTGFSSGWTPNGSASVSSNTLTLTTPSNDEAGSAFYNQKVNVTAPWEASFSETTSSGIPDGFAFVVQNDSRGTAALGGSGGDLGYGCVPNNTNCTPISNSGIVEFDTFQNYDYPFGVTDPTYAPYAAWMENGNPNNHYSFQNFSYNGDPSSPTGATEYFWIDYNADLAQISVYESPTNVKPSTPLFTQNAVDFSTILGGSSLAYIGFSGATGGATGKQVINDFSFTTTGNAPAYTIPNGGSAYDIESSNSYCTNGGTACVPNNSLAGDCQIGSAICPNLTYADVEAFGPPTGAATGTPDELILYCAVGTSSGYNYGFVDVLSSTGNADYGGTPMSPFPGVYGYADLGAISGKGAVLNDPANGTGSEDNSAQASSISASVTENGPAGYTIGSVTGIQNTDNSADTLNSGQFRITLRGTLYHFYSATKGSEPYQGAISCVAGGPHAYDLANAGLDTTSLAEGEIESGLGDNPFYTQAYPPAP